MREPLSVPAFGKKKKKKKKKKHFSRLAVCASHLSPPRSWADVISAEVENSGERIPPGEGGGLRLSFRAQKKKGGPSSQSEQSVGPAAAAAAAVPLNPIPTPLSIGLFHSSKFQKKTKASNIRQPLLIPAIGEKDGAARAESIPPLPGSPSLLLLLSSTRSSLGLLFYRSYPSPAAN